MKPGSTILRLAALALALAVPGAGNAQGPDTRVTEIRIEKAAHTLSLVAGPKVLKPYRVAIGPGGPGRKRMQGDKVTPVGRYHVTGRIKGLFPQFLVVSYPNADAVRRYGEAKRHGEIPA